MKNNIKNIKKILNKTTLIIVVVFAFLMVKNGNRIDAFAAAKAFKNDTEIYGVDISSMHLKDAEKAIRNKIIDDIKDNEIIIKTPKFNYILSYPQINFYTNINEVLNDNLGKKKNLNVNKEIVIKYYLNGCSSLIESIYSENYTLSKNAELKFNAYSQKPFDIKKEINGKEVDCVKLQYDLDNALKNFGSIKNQNINLKIKNITAKQTAENLQKLTNLKGSFTTYFYSSGSSRKSNISLAGLKISGTILQPNEEFSFNRVVGRRTAANGFKKAKIISDGAFIEGVGGGVCQVSTTLYNASILAGLKVTEQHRHSLAVSYVEPSFDAMVNSSSSDLKFLNNTDEKIFIKVTTGDSYITVKIYGLENKFNYKRVSVITGEIEPPLPTVITGIEDRIIQNEKKGLLSEGYLEKYKGETFIEKRLLRTDRYNPIKAIIETAPKENNLI